MFDLCIGQKKWQIKYRTATTTYPCFLPDLGDSTGAGRIDLPVQRYRLMMIDKTTLWHIDKHATSTFNGTELFLYYSFI